MDARSGRKNVALDMKVMIIGLLLSAPLPFLLVGESDGAVTPGSVSSITVFGQRIFENSTGQAVMGIGATGTSGGDTLDRVDVDIINQGNFALTDLAPPSTDATASGVSLYRDVGSSDDALDRGDAPVNLSSIGRSGNTYMLNLSSETVPGSITGSFHWLIVVRSSTSISEFDSFQVRITTSGVRFSGGVTSPSSSRTTDTIGCRRYSASAVGTGTIPIGEKDAPVHERAVLTLSTYSPVSGQTTLEGLEMVLGNISGFDPDDDLDPSGAFHLYIDDGATSSDVWDPAGDTRLSPTSTSITEVPGGSFRVTMEFPSSGSGAFTLPLTVTGTIGAFISVSTGNGISDRDRFNVTVDRWGISVRGADDEVKGALSRAVGSRTIQADTRAPALSGADLIVSSTLPGYFRDVDTDLSGTDMVYYNSVSGQGSGQTMRFRFKDYTEDFPDSLRGEPALNNRPNGPVDDSDSTDQQISYTVTEGNYADNPVTFTLTDKVGHTTTWDIWMVEDNTPPEIVEFSIRDSSDYIYSDQAGKQVYFRTLMTGPEYFHITGSARDPDNGSGLSRIDYTFETNLYSSPSSDTTPESFNGTYGVSASSTSTDGTIEMYVYDLVGNRLLVNIEYDRVTGDPSLTVLSPASPGTNVSGIHPLRVEAYTPGPLRDVSYTLDQGKTYTTMSFSSQGSVGAIFVSNWDTFDTDDGPVSLRFRLREWIGAYDYNLTWVNIDNYPLYGAFRSPIDGSYAIGTITISLSVSTFCTAVAVSVDDEVLRTAYAPFPGSLASVNLDTTTLSNGPHTIKAVLYGFGTEQITLRSRIVVDNSPPVVSDLKAILPTGKSALAVGDKVRFTASISDAGSGIGNAYVMARAVGGSNDQKLYDDGSHGDGSPKDGTYGTDEVMVDAVWAFHMVQFIAVDAAGNQVNRSLLVPVDPNPPLIEEAWVEYPYENVAARTGDMLQVKARVSDATASIYVTMVLDTSGSMRGDKFSALKSAAQAFINTTRSIDYLAIFRFGSGFGGMPPGDVVKVLNFTLMNDSGKDRARSIINGLIANAPTPIWDAIGEAIEYTLTEAISYPVVVAFTDGGDDYSTDTIFEEGSGSYCPWHEWGLMKNYTEHLGKYYYPGGPLFNEGYYWVYNTIDLARRDRWGILNTPLPVYTIGLGLEHHDPPNKPERQSAPSNFAQDSTAFYPMGHESGTVEYNLWRIATTSAGGTYSYAPSETQLYTIFRSLASSIYSVENPARIDSVVASLPPQGNRDIALYDDGLHDDGLAGDGVYASDPFEMTSLGTWTDKAFLQAIDWASNVGYGETELVLDNIPPSVWDVTVEYPGNWSSVADGQIFDISLKATDTMSGIRSVRALGQDMGAMTEIWLVDDGTGNDPVAGDGIYTSFNITPATGNAPAGYRFLDVTVTDGAGNPSVVRVQVLVVNDREAPVIELLHPMDIPFLSGRDLIRALISDDGVIDRARYTLSDPNGTLVKQGVLGEEDEDLFTASVDVGSLTEMYYIFNVSAVDTSGKSSWTGNLTVGVDNAYPDLKVRSPFNNSAISGLQVFDLDATDTFLEGVFYSVDGGEVRDLSGGLDTRLYQEGPHVVSVFARDLAGKVREMEFYLYFDNSDPRVNVLQPLSGQIIGSGQRFQVRGFDGGGITLARVLFYDWNNRTAPSPPYPFEDPRYSLVLDPPDVPGLIVSGDYSGYLDGGAVPDGTYLMVTQIVDRSGRVGSDHSMIIVDNDPPIVEVTFPLEGQRMDSDFIPLFTISDGSLLDAHVEFRGERYIKGEMVDISGAPEGAYQLEVVAQDRVGRSTIVSRTVYIDTTPPMITIASPGSGITLTDTLKVLATVFDPSGLSSVSLIVDGYEVGLGEMLSSDGVYSFTMDLTPIDMSEHSFRIVAVDRAGLRAVTGNRTFYKIMHDSDGDGVVDRYDDFPFDPSVSGDYDGDGFGSRFDDDDDGDGVLDIFEPDGESLFADGTTKGRVFSQDPSEWMDTDGDGIGNNADPDDDNDTILDIYDMFPLNSTESRDTDLDGIGDNADPDDDGDNVPDQKDRFPLDPDEWRDTDRDGIGNNRDDDDDGDGVPDDRDDFPLDRDRQYFWEPIVLVLFVVMFCSVLLFTGMVFRRQISDTFDRSWDVGVLSRMRKRIASGVRGMGRKRPPEEPEEPPKRGPGGKRSPPRPPDREEPKKAHAGREKGGRRPSPVGTRARSTAWDEDLEEFEEYKEEKVGGHRVRWSR